MSYQEYIIRLALMTARGEKARYRRTSRRASERQERRLRGSRASASKGFAE